VVRAGVPSIRPHRNHRQFGSATPEKRGAGIVGAVVRHFQTYAHVGPRVIRSCSAAPRYQVAGADFFVGLIQQIPFVHRPHCEPGFGFHHSTSCLRAHINLSLFAQCSILMFSAESDLTTPARGRCACVPGRAPASLYNAAALQQAGSGGLHAGVSVHQLESPVQTAGVCSVAD